ncbi:MAG: efflux RND transporter periplasmic adaptor subunit [Bacteroidales bacterium]|nr:efflux RND transporter periplasmic adaptor subunit [Bacteroidales bacterium]
MKNSIKAFALIALSAAVCAACSSVSKKSQEQGEENEQEAVVTPKVSVVAATMREVPQNGVYTSTVMPNAVNNIAPQSVNRIKSINVEIGDFVSAGQVVARMDVLNLDQAKLQMVNDSTELARIKSLYEVGGVSKSDLDAITLSYKVRKAAYENLLENTVLRSPISGVITARNYDKGDMFGMGQPIFTVQQITPVKLLVAISESEYTKVKKGQKVTLVVDALPGESFDGTISRLYPTMDAATHTFNVEVKVPNYNRRLRPGMYAKVTVNFGKNNSVIIPDKAVVRQQGAGDKFVYILNEDNTVTFKKISLGVRLGNEYEVLSGVQEGERVVTDGQLRIRDGVEVEVVE